MKTVVAIGDDLFRRVEQLMKKEGWDFNRVVEEALSLYLDGRMTDHQAQVALPISCASGGVLPGIDLNCSRDLEDRLAGN